MMKIVFNLYLLLLGLAAAYPRKTPRNIDCEVSKWSAWTTCTEICGGGTHTRTRDVTQRKQNYGKSCPALEQTEICNQRKCFSYLLEAVTGNEIVYLDGKTKLTLKKGLKYRIFTNKPKVMLAFTNAQYSHTGQDEGTKNRLHFSWYHDYYLGNSWKDFEGLGPEYISSGGGFNCGKANEHGMCQKVRDGDFKWTGKYTFTFPTTTPSPTTPPPTASPTQLPTASPTKKLKISGGWPFGSWPTGKTRRQEVSVESQLRNQIKQNQAEAKSD